jgi:N-acetylmuramoyl-L-alanine amidase
MTAVDPLPLEPGATGPAVRDLQTRLGSLGLSEPPGEADGTFGPRTERALRCFQAQRGLFDDGICDAGTWSALVEAGHRLGNRLLYLRQPMLRGDDVGQLQRGLGELGFDAGRVDGIFGPDTERALKDFQRNAGLTVDGICGRDSTAALERMHGRVEAAVPIAGVRERERLRGAPRSLTGRRVVITHPGGLGAVADAAGRALHDAGARVLVLDHPDQSVLAQKANGFDADVVVALEVRSADPATQVAYYATAGFESVGGRRLAELLAEEIGRDETATTVKGMRLPVLRETRMPAVVCTAGDPALLVTRSVSLAAACRRAIERWAEAPLPG